jgi:hypothetical protein
MGDRTPFRFAQQSSGLSLPTVKFGVKEVNEVLTQNL